MKHFFIAGILFTALVISLSCFAINVEAYDPAIPFSTFNYETDNNSIQGKYIEIWEVEDVKENFTLEKGQDIRITSLNLTNGRLVIKNGATVKIKGEIFVERGGMLEIENGTVVIDGGNITNCGTIKIGKKGTLKVQSGTLNSTAAGDIQNNGKVTCLNSGKNLDNCFKSIKKYDNNFNLSDYTLLINSNGKSAKVTAYYCINDIMTNYKYAFDVSSNGKKIKIVHSNYSLETVYSFETAQKLKNRVLSFEKNHAKELNFKMWYWKDYGYTYNYKNNKLDFNAKWFSYDDMNDKFIENDYSEKA